MYSHTDCFVCLFPPAVLQSIARKNQWPLDKMTLTVDVTKKTKDDFGHPPREGAYIYGLFMEGQNESNIENKYIHCASDLQFLVSPQEHAGTLSLESYLRQFWGIWPRPCRCCTSEPCLQRNRSSRVHTSVRCTAPSGAGLHTFGASTFKPNSLLPNGL